MMSSVVSLIAWTIIVVASLVFAPITIPLAIVTGVVGLPRSHA